MAHPQRLPLPERAPPAEPREFPPGGSRDRDWRGGFRRWGALLLAALAALGSWALLGGRLGGHGRARGYAEALTLAVAPLRAGRVAEVGVGLGAFVRRGQEVARLDTSELDAHRARLAAELGVAQAKLAAAGGVEDAAVLRSELWQLRTVAASRHDRAELAALDRELERLEGLYRDQLVRASDIEPLRRQREALAARVNTFSVAARTGRAGLGALHAPEDAHGAVVEQRLQPLREQLRVAEAALAELEVQRSAAVLRAPADGIVTSVDRRAGETVAAGAPVVTLSAGRPHVVVAFVPERQASAVRVGQTVSVSPPALWARSRVGRIIEVAPDVAEIPVRLRASPNLPAWGRRIFVDSEGPAWLPAEEVRVRF